MRRLLLALAWVCMVTSPLLARDYFVAPGGSNRNIGTETKPFQTIARGLSAATQPGDAVILREGLYQPMQTLVMANAGTPTQPITVRSAKGESAIIDGQRTPNDANLLLVASHCIRIEGLEIRKATGTGIAISGPGSRVHSVAVVNCEIHHCNRGGAFAGIKDADDPIHDILFEGNRVHDNVLRNTDKRSWDAGLNGGANVKNVIARNNTVYRNLGEGIGFYLADGCIAEGNVVYDNYSVNVYLNNATNCLVERNLVYSTGERRFFRPDGHPAVGISIANEFHGPFSNPSSHNQVTHNILLGNRYAFYYGAYQRGGGLKDTLIAHNTAFGSTGALLKIDPDGGHRNSQIVNNIFQQVGRAPLTDVRKSLPGLTFSHNLWHGGVPQTPVRGEGDVLMNPSFVAADGYTANGFKLRADSLGRHAGIKIDGVNRDFSGTLLKDRINLGAW